MNLSVAASHRFRDGMRAHQRPLLAAIVIAQWLILYNLVNWGTLLRSSILLLETPLDRAFPMVTPWIFVYSLAYPCCLAPVFLLSLPRLRTACFAYTIAICVSLFTFMLMPVGIVRPDPHPDDFGVFLLALTRTIDAPFNCFPSLHVSLDFVAAFITCTERPRKGLGLLAMAMMISVSTLFVKQHYVLDIVAGALLAGLAFRIAMQPRVRHLLGDEEEPGEPWRR